MDGIARGLSARALALVVAASSVAVVSAIATPAVAASAYDGVDRAMARRVRNDALPGGVLLAATAADEGDGGDTLHEKTFGSMRASTVIPIASASKWLTAATLLTFVDEGRVRLDDPVSKFLPEFRGAKQAITLRQLLSHTTGLPWDDCLSDSSTQLTDCVSSIAHGGDPSTTPGRAFSYSSVGFQVAGAVIEQLSGESFERAFEARVAAPLGMTRTHFDRVGTRRTKNPVPAASATSTVDDYARFLDMLANDGVRNGTRVLSAASVAEIERDQVAGLDTSGDAAVQITGIPTYGLGVWRDEVDARDDIEVVSGSGAYGFYPWIDRVHDTYGIVAVADVNHGASHAVPASQRLARQLWRVAAITRPANAN